MLVELRPEADADVLDAAAWIAADHPAAAERFLDAFEDVLDLLRRYPEIGPTASRRARKKRILGFPYNVVYQILSDRIRIVAVAHHARRPEFYRRRLR